MTTHDENKKTAYHEAGHAVMACLVDAAFPSASAQVEEENENRVVAGMIKGHTDPTFMNTPRDALQSRVRIALAGEAAVSILEDRSGPDWERLSMIDRRAVLVFLTPLSTKPRDFDKLYRQFWKDTRLCVQKRWTSVEEVADALLSRGTLQKKDLRSILKRASE